MSALFANTHLACCWCYASCLWWMHRSVGWCQGTTPTAQHMSNVLCLSLSRSAPLLHLLFVPGCHLYSINTHHGSELRIVAAIRNKLLLITRKHPRFEGFSAVAPGADSPVEEFQYIRVQQTLHEWLKKERNGWKNFPLYMYAFIWEPGFSTVQDVRQTCCMRWRRQVHAGVKNNRKLVIVFGPLIWLACHKASSSSSRDTLLMEAIRVVLKYFNMQPLVLHSWPLILLEQKKFCYCLRSSLRKAWWVENYWLYFQRNVHFQPKCKPDDLRWTLIWVTYWLKSCCHACIASVIRQITVIWASVCVEVSLSEQSSSHWGQRPHEILS